MAPTDSRSWLVSFLLRSVALFANVIAIILFAVGFPVGMILWIILYAIVALWSVTDFIFLLCKRSPHPGVNVGLDLVSCLITGIMALIGLVLYYGLGFGYHNITVVRVAVILGLIAAVSHLLLFVRACIRTHKHRRQSKMDWDVSQMNRV